MNYIIDPMWFYWVQIINALRIACIAGIAISVFIAVFGGLAINDFVCNEGKAYKVLFITCGIVFTISVIGAIFIPSRDTLISMMVAKYATYDNAQSVVDAVKSAVDYVVQAIQSVK